MQMHILYILDLIGTFVFAINGATVGSKNKLDIFGSSVIAFVTAVGGGTIRDLLIGNTPVSWIKNTEYLLAIVGGITFRIVLHKIVERLHVTLLLFDTIGIAVFTILGMQVSLLAGIHYMPAIIMGVVSAVFGGVLRDILSNRVPVIFHMELYASACMSGGLVFVALLHGGVNTHVGMVISIATIIIIRLLAVKYKLHLPRW